MRGEILQAEIENGLKNKALTLRKQQLGSIHGVPMIKNIPLNRLVPPPVHILIELCNAIIKYVYKLYGKNNP